MLTKVQKWGNSLALRLPKAVAEEVNVRLDSPVEITVRDREIVIRPAAKKKYDLDSLVAQITPDNAHGEMDFGKPAGKEVW